MHPHNHDLQRLYFVVGHFLLEPQIYLCSVGGLPFTIIILFFYGSDPILFQLCALVLLLLIGELRYRAFQDVCFC